MVNVPRLHYPSAISAARPSLQLAFPYSVLEVGPGPKSVPGYLPGRLRQKVRRYAAFEPNDLFATRLGEWFCFTSETESPLPCLKSPAGIYRTPFDLSSNAGSGTGTGTSDSDEKFDVIIFCHSVYGMKPKARFIERALEMLVEGGMVVVFHRDGTLHLDGLVCYRTASFRTGTVCLENNDETRRARRGRHGGGDGADDQKANRNGGSNLTVLDYRPSLIFDNDADGDEAAKRLAERYLLPFFHKDLQRLATMARPAPDLPRPGIEFRHVLNICQQLGGLALCSSLLETHFTGDWAKVDAVACCEAGDFVYASALASRVEAPLVLIREAGKLPPLTVSVSKSASHISPSTSSNPKERIKMDRDLMPRGASVGRGGQCACHGKDALCGAMAVT